MNIQDLGSFGEFLGALLFFVSLVYLSLQIRNASRTSSFVTLQELQRDWREINTPADTRITKAMNTELSGETPSTDERYYLKAYFLRHMRIYETLWFSFENGLLDEELFNGYIANMPDIVALARNRERWELYKDDLFHRGFVVYADIYLGKHPARGEDIYS